MTIKTGCKFKACNLFFGDMKNGKGCKKPSFFTALVPNIIYQIQPCASIASATFKKPAIFAPATRS